MDANQIGLFDLPDQEPPAVPNRSQRGRNRETWARTVTAEVTIIDPAALSDAAARAEENTVTIELQAAPTVEDPAAEDSAVGASEDPFDVLVWLVWPTDGLEGPLDADAFRILEVESEVAARSDDVGTLSWTVTVKLADVRELRRLAAQAHPGEAAAIEDSLAVAWQHAADPFAPLRSIPGIAWRPGQVEVCHVSRRAG